MLTEELKIHPFTNKYKLYYMYTSLYGNLHLHFVEDKVCLLTQKAFPIISFIHSHYPIEKDEILIFSFSFVARGGNMTQFWTMTFSDDLWKIFSFLVICTLHLCLEIIWCLGYGSHLETSCRGAYMKKKNPWGDE